MAERLRSLVLAALLLLGATVAPAQISPGPLAQPHASLEGSLKCSQCHAGKKEEMPKACLACHKEIAALAQQNRGFHTRDRITECASCHPDHAGRDFAMVSWPGGGPAERFDHRRAGWGLEQSHATAKCSACHAPKYRVSSVVALAPSRGGHWTGLETRCVVVPRGRPQGPARPHLHLLPRRGQVGRGTGVRPRAHEVPAHRRARHRHLQQLPPAEEGRRDHAGREREAGARLQGPALRRVLELPRRPAHGEVRRRSAPPAT